MVHCSGCGKAIEKVPDWLSGAKVEFVCNNCPNRQTKNIAFITLEPAEVKTTLAEEDTEDPEEVATDEPDL